MLVKIGRGYELSNFKDNVLKIGTKKVDIKLMIIDNHVRY